MKKILTILSLLISCQTFAQFITIPELENFEVQMMPFQVRLRTFPYTVQTVSKNKPLTTQVLKDYIVAGTNLKFIAQDQQNAPVGVNSDARIIVSQDGKSIKIVPKGYTITPPTPLPRRELYQLWTSKPETDTGDNYKAFTLFEKTEFFPITGTDYPVLSNFREIYTVSLSYRYLDQNGREYEGYSEDITIQPKYEIDYVSKTVKVLPFSCLTCYNKTYQIKLKYTKP